MDESLKAALDIGLGALSLLLWFRQGKVNKMQMKLDEAQTRATADLTQMVKDHESRLQKLEKNRARRSPRR